MNRVPLVSVCMITYNHEKYILSAIEAVLMQKAAFRIELVIGEDCSADDTRKICEDYLLRNPDIVRLLPPSDNLGMMPNLIRTLDACNGKYIAVCEGDDYWTDRFKLQKQVDFMEANPDCSICFHAAEHKYEDMPLNSFIQRPKRIPKNGKFSIKQAILGGGGFMPSAAMFFRAKLFHDFPEWCLRSPVGDVPIMLVLAERGKIGYLNDVMSVYRVMSANSWSQRMVQWERQKQHYFAVSRMWREFDAWTGNRYSLYVNIKLLKNKLYYYYSALLPRIKHSLFKLGVTTKMN